MSQKKKKVKPLKPKPVPDPKSPKELALAIFAAANRKLPVGKIRLNRKAKVG